MALATLQAIYRRLNRNLTSCRLCKCVNTIQHLRCSIQIHINILFAEDCLNGRRTVWEDPFKPDRNGLHGIGQRIELNSSLALVIVMLGTNDFQASHQNDAWHSAQGLAAVIRAIRAAPIEPGMMVLRILIVAPPAIERPAGEIAAKFAGAEIRCVGMAGAYGRVATEEKCAFFDAAAATAASIVDGIHLDQHKLSGEALVPQVAALLSDARSSCLS